MSDPRNPHWELGHRAQNAPAVNQTPNVDNLATVHGADDEEDEYRPPLPMEDRLWRHPSEMSTAGAPAAVSVSTIRTSWKQGVTLASLGAAGGALIVAGLFLTLGDAEPVPQAASPGPAYSTIALDPFVPIPRAIDADHWPAEVVADTGPGIARVVGIQPSGRVTGSGVVFRSDGVLLTSHDVVVSATTIIVSLEDGSSLIGQVVGLDAISGLAVVQVDELDMVVAPLGIFKPAPEIGDYAVALGGLASAGELSLMRLSSTAVNVPVGGSRHLHGLLQLDGGMPANAAGGGAIDDSGAVIGIIVDVQTENATYAVPIGYARKIAADILRYGEAKHAWLGIRGIDLDIDMADDLGVDGAVRIATVIDGSPAHAADLRKGDVLIGIDGDPVLSMTELILELRNHPPGGNIEVRFMREHTTFRVNMDLDVRHVGDTT
jgi:S1-C subfamily serine protease